MLQCVNTGPVAQRSEQGTHNPLVPGSNPGGPNVLVANSANAERALAGRPPAAISSLQVEKNPLVFTHWAATMALSIATESGVVQLRLVHFRRRSRHVDPHRLSHLPCRVCRRG